MTGASDALFLCFARYRCVFLYPDEDKTRKFSAECCYHNYTTKTPWLDSWHSLWTDLLQSATVNFIDKLTNEFSAMNERKGGAERLSCRWRSHTHWSLRQLDSCFRAVLCDIPLRRSKWCMKRRHTSSAGSTHRTLAAIMGSFWWVLAVTPGHNFHSAPWSQTAFHSGKTPESTLSLFSKASSSLPLELSCKFISSWTSLPWHFHSQLLWWQLIVPVIGTI